jgi:GT2 family glycosyltransferase
MSTEGDGAVDVVVVAYNSAPQLGTCLDAARRQARPGTVVVVDHGADGSAAVARRHGAVVIENPANPGFGAGHNRGVARTDAPYILLLNPDAELVGDIDAARALLDADPAVAAVQGRIRNLYTGGDERSSGRELAVVHLLGRALGLGHLRRLRVARAFARRVPMLRDHVERVPASPTDVDVLVATAVLVRRQAFEAVGGFDESYFLYGEDLDLCRRLRAAGWRLVALPSPWAVHESGGSAAGWWDRELRWWEGTLRFAGQWWSAPAFAGALVAAGVQTLKMVVRSPTRWWAAVGTLLVGPVRGRVREDGDHGSSPSFVTHRSTPPRAVR